MPNSWMITPSCQTLQTELTQIRTSAGVGLYVESFGQGKVMTTTTGLCYTAGTDVPQVYTLWTTALCEHVWYLIDHLINLWGSLYTLLRSFLLFLFFNLRFFFFPEYQSFFLLPQKNLSNEPVWHESKMTDRWNVVWYDTLTSCQSKQRRFEFIHRK